jgi:CDP-diacylglycerol--serine O-phosphatidyltransferase
VAFDNEIPGDFIFYPWFKIKWIAWAVTLFSGLSMVSDLRFYSGKDINLKNSVPFVVILLIVLAFVLISYSPPEVLFFVALVYGLSGYALWLLQYSKREKTAAEQIES